MQLNKLIKVLSELQENERLEIYRVVQNGKEVFDGVLYNTETQEETHFI